MTQTITIDFEFEVGDFVVRTTPLHKPQLNTYGNFDPAPMQVLSRRWVDGRILYDTRLPTGNVDEFQQFELESWESFAVRNKLTEQAGVVSLRLLSEGGKSAGPMETRQ